MTPVSCLGPKRYLSRAKKGEKENPPFADQLVKIHTQTTCFRAGKEYDQLQ
jgi:hypothetical protein